MRELCGFHDIYEVLGAATAVTKKAAAPASSATVVRAPSGGGGITAVTQRPAATVTTPVKSLASAAATVTPTATKTLTAAKAPTAAKTPAKTASPAKIAAAIAAGKRAVASGQNALAKGKKTKTRTRGQVAVSRGQKLIALAQKYAKQAAPSVIANSKLRSVHGLDDSEPETQEVEDSSFVPGFPDESIDATTFDENAMFDEGLQSDASNDYGAFQTPLDDFAPGQGGFDPYGGFVDPGYGDPFALSDFPSAFDQGDYDLAQLEAAQADDQALADAEAAAEAAAAGDDTSYADTGDAGAGSAPTGDPDADLTTGTQEADEAAAAADAEIAAELAAMTGGTSARF